MILYHVITIYHLLNAIVHRAKYHPEEHSLLILPDFFSKFFSPDQCHELMEKHFFDEIYFFPYQKCNQINEEEVIAISTKFMDNSIPYEISAFNSIYVWGVHFFFTLGLIERGISFTGAEEAAGAFSKQEICRDAIKANKLHYELAEKNGLLDYSNEFMLKIICNLSLQKEEMLKNPRLTDFAVVYELLQLPQVTQQDILRLFRAPSIIKFAGKQTLLLTQHFMNLDLLSYEEQKEIYLTFADYFLNATKLVIKPHPSDYMDYCNIFPGCEILSPTFPIELLPLLCNCAETTLATIYSTGIDNIKNCFRKTISLNMAYRDAYTVTPAFWLSLKILLSLSENITTIGVIGVNTLLLETLIHEKCKRKIHLSEITPDDQDLPAWIIIDDISQSTFDRNRLQNLLFHVNADKTNYIFINSKHDYCYYEFENRQICRDIIPVNYQYLNRKNEILILSKNQSTKERIKKFSMSETLNYSKEKIETCPMSEEEIRIAILEGTLQATEERLQYYIQLVNDIRNGRCR